MGSPIRITGMNSGLDTESIIKALTTHQQEKVTKLEGEQKRLTWKQDKWKELNKKVTDLYNGTLASMRFTDAFSKKTTTASRPSAVTVVTGSNAMNTTQKMQVKSLASNAYMTGSKVSTKTGVAVGSGTKLSNLTGNDFTSHEETYDVDVPMYREKILTQEVQAKDEEGNPKFEEDGTTPVMETIQVQATDENGDPKVDENGDPVYVKVYEKLKLGEDGKAQRDGDGNLIYEEETLSEAEYEALGDAKDATAQEEKTRTVYPSQSFTLKFGENGETHTIEVNGDMTIGDLVNKLRGIKENGNALDVNFDETQQRFYIASNKSGADASFDFGGLDGVLGQALGLKKGEGADDAHYESGTDAEIVLNGTTYKSSKNNFDINGLTITVNETTKNSAGTYDEITLTTKSDTSGVYDMIKKFVKEYSELINEMDKLYHADSAKSYKMLTDDEKEAMDEDDVKAWEDKIKDGLLSGDRTLNDVASGMKSVMSGLYTVKNGNGEELNIGLSYFGINTLSYFEAKANEKYALYIDGDKDSENYNVKAAEDKLNKLITNDPELVTNFFITLSRELYGKLGDLMKGSQFSSSFTLYEDKMMNKQYSSYTDKIADANEKLGAMEDKYYKKFGKMESSLGTLNSTQSALSGYFGG